MAQQPIIEIAEFPHDNRVWRIDYLGTITSQLQHNNNLLVEVILRPVSHDTVSDFSEYIWYDIENPEWQQRCSCFVGIGTLPILTIGSLWKNGVLLPENAFSQIHTFSNLCIDNNHIQLIDSNHRITYSVGKSCKLIFQRDFGINNDKPISCLIVPHPNYEHGIIVPVMEIIRFYYACSSNLAHLAFSNPQAISKIHYDVNPENNKVFINLPQKYRDNEAFVLARILTDDVAFCGFEKIKNSLIQSSINSKNTALLATDFPFNGLTNLTVRGIQIHGSRFLVTEICSCSAPFPNVIIARQNDNRKSNEPSNKPDNEKEVYQREKPIVQEDDNLPIQNQEECAAYVEPLVFNLNKQAFTDLANKEIEKLQKSFNLYKNQTRIVEHKNSATGLGTDLGTTASTRTAPATIDTLPEKHQQREALAATFEHTVQAIEYVDKHFGNFQAAVYVSESPNFRFVPLLKSHEKRQWSYLDSDTYTRRNVLIGKFVFQGQSFWLLEIEPRENESFTTAIIHLKTDDYEKLLREVLFAIAKNKGVWDKIPPNLNWQIATLKHTHKDIASFAQKICAKVIELTTDF